MSLFYLLAIIFPLLCSQILRVRLFNYLVNPHFSIGLRSGIFMNAICSFLNIITPFRLGEIYRFRFLSSRYQSPPAISILSILVERLLDALLLIIAIFVFSDNNALKTSIAQLVFVSVTLALFLSIFFLRENPVFSKTFTQWSRQLSLVKGKTLGKILFCSIQIWILYLVAGFYSCKFLSAETDTWFKWNTKSYRLVNFELQTFQQTQKFNALFIFSFLFIGLLASVMGHKSNKFTEIIHGSTPDASQKGREVLETNTRFARTIFLESPLENYWRKASNSGAINTVFKGGSGALVYSPNFNNNIVRKVGFGNQKLRLKDQFHFLESFPSLWAFPEVKNPVMTETYFSFDMELIKDSTPFYTHLSELTSERDRYKECLRLFSFIESGNRTTRSINLGEYKLQIEKLWNVKLKQIVDEIYVRMPIMSVNDKIFINGKEYSSLQNVYNTLKGLALEADPILEETEPHGDSTLSNLLIEKNGSSIRSIDPNPNQLVRNSSIDHGKVLQSLLLKYEDSLLYDSNVLHTRSAIRYTPVLNGSIENCGQYYLEILEKRKGASIIPELMCFTSMLRLMPYRLNYDVHQAPIFLAQTIEFGNSLVEKYTK